MVLLKITLWGFLGFAQADIPIQFENEITTCLTKRSLWIELERSMYTSKDSWLWPNDYSTVDGEGLFSDSLIKVTYDTGLFSPTYSYKLENVVDLETMTYTAVEDDHPFKGGATLTLSETSEATVFKWTGLYLTRPVDFLQRQFFKRFSKNFFEKINFDFLFYIF